MAVLMKERRQVDRPPTMFAQTQSEDVRLMLRINAAAAELHRLWSADWSDDPEGQARRRASVSALQSEIDDLYDQRRHLVAQRAVLAGAPAGRSRIARPDMRLAA